jgi:hypothetical protein
LAERDGFEGGKMNETSRIIILIASILQLLTMPLMAQEQGSNHVDDSESYAVYRALLPAEWTVRIAHAKTLVFQQETTIHQRCMPSEAEVNAAWQPVVENFRTANTTAWILLPEFDLGIPYTLASSSEIQSALRLVSNDPWVGFYKRYPDSGGYMMVSAVGFDALKGRALVYMAHSCGLLCGGGRYHFLEKINGVWRETKIPGVPKCSWIS